MAGVESGHVSLLQSVKEFFGISQQRKCLRPSELTVRNLTATRLTIDVGVVLRAKATPIGPNSAPHDDAQLAVEPFTSRVANADHDKDDNTAISHLGLPDGLVLTSNVLNATTTNSLQILSNAPITQRIAPIYDAVNEFLALYELPDLTSWMRDFRDDTSIAALSIPGTHNSPTYHWALPSVRCQAVSPLKQMHNGVRFFDIRVQAHRPEDPECEDLYLVHGAFPISLTGPKKFRHLVDEIEEFLAANPSETLIISLKREGIGKATDQQLADIIETHYAQHWYTEPRLPTIGEVRGKIVLLRRFGLSDRLKREHNGAGWALDAESWADNTSSCVHGQVCVQDFYGVLNTQLIPKKIEVSCAQFERSGAMICPVAGVEVSTAVPELIYLNFLTASNFFNFRCWPENIAAKLNPAVIAFLCEKHSCGVGADSGDGGLGIVVCDWVGKHGDWDLVKCIVGMNARRLYRERGYGWNKPA